ncbi:MAG: CHAT domain-containing protein [Oscillatoriales cyanobacterium C42_A2020_001]|nr:CHAT domain-containing protein [Leptolyngbyaceae cyanobacterium C42_A2020_001]
MSRIKQGRLRRSLLFGLGFLVSLWLGCWGGWTITVQARTPSVIRFALADQGLQQYQAGRFAAAIVEWERALTQVTDPRDRVILLTNLGQAYRQIGKLDRAIAQWEAAIQLYRSDRSLADDAAIAQLVTEQAQAYSDLGQHQVAVERAESAIALAQKAQDLPTEAAAQGAIGSARWALGEYEGALAANQQSLILACQLNHTPYIATALNNLGNVFVSRAEQLRYQARAARLEGETPEATMLEQLADQNVRVALAAYQQSVTVSQQETGATEPKALLNLDRLLKNLPPSTPIPVLPELTCAQLNVAGVFSSPVIAGQPAQPMVVKPFADAKSPIPPNHTQLLAQLEAKPDSQDKAFGYISLANSLIQNADTRSQKPEIAVLKPILERALAIARLVKDPRSESFALGTLGHLYELNQQYDAAIALTRKAQFTAQGANAADSLYRWQWQSGRLLKATGQLNSAIAAYDQAIATLQTIRSDIIAASKDLQFDFRDSVEPVYRELIGLLLTVDESRANTPSPVASSAGLKSLPVASASQTTNSPNLEKVLDVLELLKLAELQNFFGDECVQVAKDGIAAEQRIAPGQASIHSAIDPNAVVVYSVVLEDRSYLLLRSPNGRLKKYPIQLTVNGKPAISTRISLQTQIDQLRSLLEKRSTDEYLVEAQAIYNALIRPLETDLSAIQPSTLVFVNDGVLRKVPMAALHDGQQFLVEKYPIATTPSLNLTSRRSLDRRNLNALAVGLTLEQPPFSALPNVEVEVKEVHHLLGGTKLLDQDFTLKGVRDRLQGKRYPIVHMATHGKFGGDAASTFLLTYRDRITIDKLDEVLQTRQNLQPVELLTLSACQTAAGDERSALGIAGLAVRAGVKSAMATLWFINDEATVPLVEEFYTQLLKPGTTKAEALQRAQKKLIQDINYNHPAVWSSFILIGNWM